MSHTFVICLELVRITNFKDEFYFLLVFLKTIIIVHKPKFGDNFNTCTISHILLINNYINSSSGLAVSNTVCGSHEEYNQSNKYI